MLAFKRPVSVMFDLDREGENGAKQTILALAEHCRVRYTWLSAFAEGNFRGLHPETISRD